MPCCLCRRRARPPAPGPAVPPGGSRAGAPALRPGRHRAELAPFFADLPQRLAAAHLVIGRAGASTVAELATIGRPSILMPCPTPPTITRRQTPARSRRPAPHRDPARRIHRRRPWPDTWRPVAAPQRSAAMAAAADAAGRPDAAARLADLVGEMTGLALHREWPQRALPLDIGRSTSSASAASACRASPRCCTISATRCRAAISPRAPTPTAARAGIQVAIGHHADNIGDAQVVVVSRAIKKDNPEVRRRGRASCRCAPRRNAGRTHAAANGPSRSAARTARPRRRRWSPRCSTPAGSIHGDQWRHHQRLRLQRAARQGRLDGGRGRRSDGTSCVCAARSRS